MRAQSQQHTHNAQAGVKRQLRWWHWALVLLAIELVVSVAFFVSALASEGPRLLSAWKVLGQLAQ